jgi:hypothetical protein
MFMPSSGSLKPESSVKACRLFQIVDTPESSETPLNTLRCATPHKANRTVVVSGIVYGRKLVNRKAAGRNPKKNLSGNGGGSDFD